MKIIANWIWSDDSDGRAYNLCSAFRRDFRLDAPPVSAILAIAAAYFLVTVFVVPWMLERKVMRQLKRSVSFGKELSYEADHYGICYTVAGGKTYQLYWNKLTSA